MSMDTETPGVWTVSANYANRHPAEVREFAREHGAVRIIETRSAEIAGVFWLTAAPPPWGEIAVPDDRAVIEAALHRDRSAARKAAWARRDEVPA